MTNVLYKLNKVLPLTIILGIALVLNTSNSVYADDCDPEVYGGKICNKSFKIEKDVRKAGSDDSFEDKVTFKNVKKGDKVEVEFRIRIKNVGDLETDNMSYKDKLPSEMSKSGGSGLTEDWDNFEPGEEVKYYIKAKIDPEEFDNAVFDKCIVNKVELFWNKKFEGADTATVCFSNKEITELPSTGPTANIVMTILGLTSLTSGLGLKKIWS